ncbi:WD40-repeat-containing domain protein [Xylariomycetidae sp. FL2044]|nr:WD40-repeat-containing domain protein [Xylariomycetidae sp. FL2044]
MEPCNQQHHCRPTTANPLRRNRSLSHSLPWHRRPKSLGLEDADLSTALRELRVEDRQHEQNGGPSHNTDSGKAASKLKVTLRRASLSLKGIVRPRRRASEALPEDFDSRPTTAHPNWSKFLLSASFRHPSKSSQHDTHTDHGYMDPSSSFQSDFSARPVPGNRLAPPIIPQHTGAAAKAAVAMQNEFAHFYPSRPPWISTETLNDQESGIGIALSTAESQTGTLVSPDTSVPRVNFILRLPLELAIQILSHLDAAQLGSASRVSRWWYEVVQDSHIWKQSFLQHKTGTYATSISIQPGTGCGIPPVRPGNDWQKIYRAREELDRRWNTGHQAKAVYLHGHLDSIYCLQFDENKIITGSRDKTLRIWDMRSYQCRMVIGPPEVVNQSSILFDPNGVPTHYANLHDNPADCSGLSVPVTASFPVHHKASILCLQYDDDILVTGSSDSTCIIHSVRSGYRPIRRLHHHSAAILDLAFDGKHIVTCSKDITICVWDRNTGELINQLHGHTGPVNAVQLRGNTIVSCSGDFSVKLWNIDSGKVVREFAGHTKGLACSQFSEDGKYIASAGSDKVIRIWDANTGECVREVPAHASLVRSLHIDSATGRLISGSYDTDIKVFDMESGDLLLDFPRWHASWVLSAKSDYRRIISTGQDPKILIMDFGADIPDIEMLESTHGQDVAREAGFI